MQVLKFEFDIKRELPFVFENLYNDDVYKKWASAFSPRAHYVGELVEGAELKFLDDNANGVGCTVNKLILNEYLEFLVTYEIFEGVPKYLDTPGREVYNFSAIDSNTTHVSVQVDVQSDHVEMTKDMWEIAVNSIIKTFESL